MLVQAGAAASCLPGAKPPRNPQLSPCLLRRRLGGLGLALLLAGCAGPPPQPASGTAPGNDLRILVYRGGTAARLGHNHVLRAGDLRVSWPATGPELRFRLDALLIDPPELRAVLGEGFASAVDADARTGTRVNLLKALDAATYPEVVVRTLSQVGEGARRAVEVEITLHGVSRRQWLAVAVDGCQARGRAVLRQSDFGIQPFTVLGGLLAVQDVLVVEFELRQP